MGGAAEAAPPAGSQQRALKCEPHSSSSDSSSGSSHSSNDSSSSNRANVSSLTAASSPRSPRAKGGAAAGGSVGLGPPTKRVRTDSTAAAAAASSSQEGSTPLSAAAVPAAVSSGAAAACVGKQQQLTAEGQERGAAAGGRRVFKETRGGAVKKNEEEEKDDDQRPDASFSVSAAAAGGSGAAATVKGEEEERRKGFVSVAAAEDAVVGSQQQLLPEKHKKEQHSAQQQQKQQQQQDDAFEQQQQQQGLQQQQQVTTATEDGGKQQSRGGVAAVHHHTRAARAAAADMPSAAEQTDAAAAAAATAAAKEEEEKQTQEERSAEEVKGVKGRNASRNSNNSGVDVGGTAAAAATVPAASAAAAAAASPPPPEAAAAALADLLRETLLPNGETRAADAPDAAAAANILKSEVPNTVFKVFCTHCEPHYSQPWATRRQTTSTSSGFVTVDSENHRCLLTNAHSVEHAAVVQVRKRGDHRKYEAKVLCIGLDCDLAMLHVSDSDFWEGVGPPLQWGPSPLLEDPVTVVGYPLGGDNSSVTQGVVSRTDLQQYSMGSSSLLAIQIDAAINPGNSGGPALNKYRQCVGIAFQSLRDGDTENIGYIIPSEVVRHFLEDYRRHGKYLGFGDGGFSWQKLENRYLRQALGLKSRHDGILIKKLDGASAASHVLRKGDMLLEVNGQSIASDGTVPFRNGERILFTWLFSQMFVGDTCTVKILREAEGEKEFSFTVGKLNLLVPANSELMRPEYLIVGGLVFVTLSEPFLKSEYGDDFDARAPVRLLDRWQHGFQSFPGEQYVVLTHVLAHSLTVGYEHLHNTQVKAFNGVSIKTLRHLADLVDASEDEYWRFDLDHEEVVVLQAKAARAALPQILQRNMIPTYKSFASS